MLKADILREPNTEKRTLYVMAASAVKKETSPDGVGIMMARFWLKKSSEQSTVSHEFPVPSWWTPAQFLGALFVKTKDSKCWVVHCNFVDLGLPLQLPHVSMSGINGALDWSPDEMDCNLRHNGALSAVSGGRQPQTGQSAVCACRV